MSPNDPINMIRIEGEAPVFGFVGLVWFLVNSSYIHMNEFGNRNVEFGNVRMENIQIVYYQIRSSFSPACSISVSISGNLCLLTARCQRVR